MLTSALFAGDPLLEAIASDQDRISRVRHHDDPAVLKVQTALLVWDPDCLPVNGADGLYADETAAAVVRFKIEVIGVPPDSVFDDVGPQTVLQLDVIMAEHSPPPGPGPVDPRTRALVRATLTNPASPSVAALAAELVAHGVSLTPAELAVVMGRLIEP